FVVAQNETEQAALVGDADEHDVARIGYPVGEDGFGQAQLDMLQGAAVDHGEALDVDDPEKLGLLVAEDALGDQRVQRLPFEVVAPEEHLLDPVAHGLELGAAMRASTRSSVALPVGDGLTIWMVSVSVSILRARARSKKTAPTRA